MFTLKIRQTEDLEEVLRMDRICFPHDAVKELGDSELWLVTTDDGTSAGYASLTVQEGGAKAFLSRSGVLPAYRGHGLQKRLIRARLAWCRKHAVPRIWTYAWVGNIASVRSLCSQGFLPYYWHRDETCDGGKGATFIYLEYKF